MTLETDFPGGTVVAGFAREFPAYVSSLGHDLRPFAELAGIDPADFASLSKRISLDAFCRLLTALATALNKETLGLDYGRYRTGGASSAFGQGFVSAPKIKDMLLFYTRYIGTVVDHRSFDATFERQIVTISWDYSPLVSNTDQFVDAALVSFLKVLSKATHGRQTYKEFQLRRAKPKAKRVFLEAYPAKLTYSNSVNCIVLSANTLEMQNPFSNDVMFELMSTECERQLQQMRNTKSLVTQLRENILEAISSGGIPIASAARELGLSVRTLQRRLSEEGFTFDGLTEEVRFSLVTSLLEGSKVSLGEIAFATGYSDQSSFSRAVVRKFGCSPTELRDRLRKS